ncbi:unnamed protein product, partial [Nippostrongylus brasiliensis]|uniref:Filaggrin-2-like n=1 Tax=Nippostrongylus brasiliensis TaxID=27835 RepID=A0A0N4YL60_NIPBR
MRIPRKCGVTTSAERRHKCPQYRNASNVSLGDDSKSQFQSKCTWKVYMIIPSRAISDAGKKVAEVVLKSELLDCSPKNVGRSDESNHHNSSAKSTTTSTTTDGTQVWTTSEVHKTTTTDASKGNNRTSVILKREFAKNEGMNGDIRKSTTGGILNKKDTSNIHHISGTSTNVTKHNSTVKSDTKIGPDSTNTHHSGAKHDAIRISTARTRSEQHHATTSTAKKSHGNKNENNLTNNNGTSEKKSLTHETSNHHDYVTVTEERSKNTAILTRGHNSVPKTLKEPDHGLEKGNERSLNRAPRQNSSSDTKPNETNSTLKQKIMGTKTNSYYREVPIQPDYPDGSWSSSYRSVTQQDYGAIKGDRYEMKRPRDSEIFTRQTPSVNKTTTQQDYRYERSAIDKTMNQRGYEAAKEGSHVKRSNESQIFRGNSSFSNKTTTQHEYTVVKGERFDAKRPKDSEIFHGDGSFTDKTMNQ